MPWQLTRRHGRQTEAMIGKRGETAAKAQLRLVGIQAGGITVGEENGAKGRKPDVPPPVGDGPRRKHPAKRRRLRLAHGNGSIDGGLERQPFALVAGAELHAVGRGILQQAVVARDVALLGFPLVLRHKIQTLRACVGATEEKLHPLGPPRGRIGGRGKKKEVGIARQLHAGNAAHRGAEQQGVLVAHARRLLKRVAIGRRKAGRKAAALHCERVFVVPVVAHGVRGGKMQTAVGGQFAVCVPAVALESIRCREPSAVLSAEIMAVVAPRAGKHHLVVAEKEASHAHGPLVGRIRKVRTGRPGPHVAAPRRFAQRAVQAVGFERRHGVARSDGIQASPRNEPHQPPPLLQPHGCGSSPEETMLPRRRVRAERRTHKPARRKGRKLAPERATPQEQPLAKQNAEVAGQHLPAAVGAPVVEIKRTEIVGIRAIRTERLAGVFFEGHAIPQPRAKLIGIAHPVRQPVAQIDQIGVVRQLLLRIALVARHFVERHVQLRHDVVLSARNHFLKRDFPPDGVAAKGEERNVAALAQTQVLDIHQFAERREMALPPPVAQNGVGLRLVQKGQAQQVLAPAAVQIHGVFVQRGQPLPQLVIVVVGEAVFHPLHEEIVQKRLPRDVGLSPGRTRLHAHAQEAQKKAEPSVFHGRRPFCKLSFANLRRNARYCYLSRPLFALGGENFPTSVWQHAYSQNCRLGANS